MQYFFSFILASYHQTSISTKMCSTKEITQRKNVKREREKQSSYRPTLTYPQHNKCTKKIFIEKDTFPSPSFSLLCTKRRKKIDFYFERKSLFFSLRNCCAVRCGGCKSIWCWCRAYFNLSQFPIVPIRCHFLFFITHPKNTHKSHSNTLRSVL